MNNNIEQDSSNSGIPALPFAALVIVALAALGMVIRYSLFGHLSLVYCVFAVFFSTNLLICFWEISLYLGHDQLGRRADHWRNLHRETGVSPAMAFLGSKVPSKNLSPAFWVVSGRPLIANTTTPTRTGLYPSCGRANASQAGFRPDPVSRYNGELPAAVPPG